MAGREYEAVKVDRDKLWSIARGQVGFVLMGCAALAVVAAPITYPSLRLYWLGRRMLRTHCRGRMLDVFPVIGDASRLQLYEIAPAVSHVDLLGRLQVVEEVVEPAASTGDATRDQYAEPEAPKMTTRRKTTAEASRAAEFDAARLPNTGTGAGGRRSAQYAMAADDAARARREALAAAEAAESARAAAGEAARAAGEDDPDRSADVDANLLMHAVRNEGTMLMSPVHFAVRSRADDADHGVLSCFQDRADIAAYLEATAGMDKASVAAATAYDPPYDAVLSATGLCWMDEAAARSSLEASMRFVRPGGVLVLMDYGLPKARALGRAVDWADKAGVLSLRVTHPYEAWLREMGVNGLSDAKVATPTVAPGAVNTAMGAADAEAAAAGSADTARADSATTTSRGVGSEFTLVEGRRSFFGAHYAFAMVRTGRPAPD